MGWKGESRRHSLSRKGIKTNIDQHKRLSVRNFVARGKLEPINKIDAKYRISNKYYDDITLKIKIINEKHTKRIEEGLTDLGFTEDEISNMKIDAYVRSSTFEMIGDFNLSFSPFDTPELSEWINERIKKKPNADLIRKLETREEQWLHKEISTLFMGEIRPHLENTTANIEEELLEAGYTKDMISDMSIDDWQLAIFYEKMDKALKTKKYIRFDTPLSQWMQKVEMIA